MGYYYWGAYSERFDRETQELTAQEQQALAEAGIEAVDAAGGETA